jgi:hypothetical protein
MWMRRTRMHRRVTARNLQEGELTMKFRIALTSSVALALLASTGLGLHAAEAHHDPMLRAALHAYNEVLPNTSPATGTLRATMNEAAKTITFTLEYRNMTGNPTGAHIHFGKSQENGGILVFFCGGGGKPACPASTSGTITGTITAADVVGIPAQGVAPGDFASVVFAIRSGTSYANIHSAKWPMGELRGQISGSGVGHSDDRGDTED